MREFFAELKRRHVYRAAVFYAALAWVLVQIADIVLENFNLPERGMQLLILGTALGFPVILVLAWLYELSLSGIRRTPPLEPAAEDDSPSPKQAIAAPAAGDQRPGLVVLPFQTFSGEPVDEFVADGFTEDLTTLLAHVPEFFVVSRNTAYMYKEHMKDLREVGAELGVRYLLEGSLRRKGDNLRITAQLIEAETGSHLWADHYDTPAVELEQVQDTLTHSIALQLGSELARAEFKVARRQQPSDMDAWSLYQNAKRSLLFQGWSKDSVRDATDQLRKAIALDPDYAAPQAYLSLLLALAHWIKLVDDLPSAHDESVAAADRALDLEPNSPEVLGYAGCAFSDLGYRQRGIPLLQKAIELDASNAQARAALGAALIVSGELEAGIADLAEAVKISPKDPGLAMWSTILALGTGYTGDIERAEEWAKLAYKTDSRFFPGLLVLAWVQAARGQREDAQTFLNEAARLYPELSAEYVSGFLGDDLVRKMQQSGLVFPS